MYLTFEELNPLRTPEGKLAFLKYNEMDDVIGRPYSKDEKSQIAEFDPDSHHPSLVFLGLDLQPSSDASGTFGNYTGVPYFALDVTGNHYASFKGSIASSCNKYTPTRVDITLPHTESAIYSHARSFLEWNTRNRFCSSCGVRTLSVHGGAKVVCPPTEKGVPRQRACSTRTGLHNQVFPKTDPTVMIAPISADAKRVLLGRGKRWPASYFSCLSGFVEPGEFRDGYTTRGVLGDRYSY